MTTHEQIPSFLAEMPEAARASYLNPSIVPKPLPSGLARVMPWRGELLPTVLQEYARDVAERTQCPPDFVGVALVVAVSAVVGRKFTIHPKQHDDWTVVPNQWGVIIGRPSAMKKPALKQALRPLDALETRERNRHSMALEEYRKPEAIQAKQMGHSDWTMIARVYGRWMPSADADAGGKAESLWASVEVARITSSNQG